MTTTFTIEYSSQARRFLDNLDKAEAVRFLNKMDEVAADPFRYLEHFEGPHHKLRVGKLRALVDLDTKQNVLSVRVLDKRGRIYK